MGSLDVWLVLALCVASTAYLCHWAWQTYGSFFQVTSRPRAVRKVLDGTGRDGEVMDRSVAFGDMRRRPWAPERTK